MKKVSINIVTWNSMKFIPDLLASIMEQTWTDFNVLVIDNGSNDGIEEFLLEKYPEVTLLRNARNLGFAPAHNQGIRYFLDHWEPSSFEDRFVLVTNPDLILEPNYLERLMAEVSNERVGSYGGKLLRVFEQEGDLDFHDPVKSDVIDSTGIRASRFRTIRDRGAGEIDEGQYDDSRDVFGVSGALVLYRAQALQDVRYEDEFFDADFFAYKEDVDLAWRMQHKGWKSRFVPDAVAYHYRGMFGKEKVGLLRRVLQRRSNSDLRKYYSTRNHQWMLWKNMRIVNYLLCFLWLVPYEIGRFIFTLLFETRNVKAYFHVVSRLRRMFKKRKVVLSDAVSSREIRSWFS